MTGAEGVAVGVFQLYQVSAELGHVVIYHILQGAGRELRVFLDDAYVSRGVDDIGLDVPEGRVAEEIGVVVQEFGGAHHLAEALPVLLDELGALGTQEIHFLLVPLFLGTGGISQSRRCERQQQHGDEPSMRALQYHCLRAFQTSRVNSHWENRGSITM